MTFSGARAARLGQPVLYVTERCVFELTLDGLALTETAPGIDLERDILANMAFRPVIGELREMDGRIFSAGPMDLRTELLRLDIPERIAFDPESGRLFVNFEKMRVRTRDDVARIRAQVRTDLCAAWT